MEEEGRALLRTMLIASALVTAANSAVTIVASGRIEQVVPAVAVVGLQLTSLLLLRWFKTQRVAVFYLVSITIATVPIAMLDHGVEGQAYYNLMLAQIVAALLFELRIALMFSALAIAGGWPLVVAMRLQKLPEVPAHDPLISWLGPASAFLLVTVALSAVHRRLRDAVRRAHESTERVSKANEALRLENERRQLAEAEARAGSHAKSAFLANVSHDLRTPMNAVVGLTDLLLCDELPARHRDHLETIRASSEGLLRLLNDILDLSKIEAGSMTFERLPVKIRDLAEGVCRLFFEAIRAKGLTFEVAFAERVPTTLDVDPTRLKQVLVNLIGNAVKFTEQGSVRVYFDWEADMLSVRVVDTGVGIAEEHRETLFLPFSQGDASTTRRFGGTGLGLAIVARLCELMGGAISVESEQGVGSTFTATVAAKLASLPVAANVSALANLPVIDPSVRILIAEDNPVNQKVALRLLERLGLKADVAGNGRLAFERTETTNYDVILMDLQMPELDGLEAMRLIRTFAKLQPVIIALTANAMLEDERACLNAGADEFLTKPVKLHELATVIARQLSKRRAQPQRCAQA